MGKGGSSAENDLFALRPPAESDLVPRRPATLTCPPNLSSFAKELSRRAADAVPRQGSVAALRRGIDAVPRRGASTVPQRGTVVGVLLWRRDIAAGWRRISVAGLLWRRAASPVWAWRPVEHEKLSWRHEIQREESLRLCGRGRWRWAQLHAFSVHRRRQWAQLDFFIGLGWGRGR